MSGQSRDLDWFLSKLPDSNAELPDFTAAEAGRRSIAAFINKQQGKPAPESHGSIRLGQDVTQADEAPLAHVCAVALAWQRLINAIGATICGIHSARGALPNEVLVATSLNLVASPIPGSVGLNLAPAAHNEQLRSASGNHDARLSGLIDKATLTVTDLLKLAESTAASHHAALEMQLRELGPRAASSLAQLTNAVLDAGLNLHVEWCAANTSPKSAALNQLSAQLISRLIDNKGLAVEQLTLKGKIVTLSSEHNWVIAANDGERITAQVSDQIRANAHSLRINTAVEATFNVATHQKSDGTTMTGYSLVGIQSVDEAA